jgi:hypothetical protein
MGSPPPIGLQAGRMNKRYRVKVPTGSVNQAIRSVYQNYIDDLKSLTSRFKGRLEKEGAELVITPSTWSGSRRSKGKSRAKKRRAKK